MNFIRKKICDGVNFSNIKDTRFKTGRISITVFLPLEKEDASKNAIVPFLLSKTCKQYPDLKSLNDRLEDLYGVSVGAEVSKLGETQVLSISASFLDDEYSLEKESISEGTADLLCKMFFEPILENGKFLEKNVEQEKRQLIETIEAEYNDKRIFAKNKCEEWMCKNEKFGINRLGTIEQVEKLTPEEIFKAWQNILSSAQIEITLLGKADSKTVFDKFKKEFNKINRTNVVTCSTKIIKRAEKVSEYTDEMEVSQSKLVMGFRTEVSADDDLVNAMRVAVALFGVTPHSKLFLNVREKYSLCYYCAAKYDKNKGIMLVQSGVENQNINKAKEEILNQLEEVKKGKFTEEDVDSIKKSLANSFRTVGDYLSSMENFYLSQIFDKNKFTTDELIEKINKVTRDEIITAANMITLDTIYVLKGVSGNR